MGKVFLRGFLPEEPDEVPYALIDSGHDTSLGEEVAQQLGEEDMEFIHRQKPHKSNKPVKA